MNPFGSLSVFLTEGGPIVTVILAVFAVGAALAAERAVAVVSATRARPHRLVAEAMGMIDRNNVTSALELCRGSQSIASAPLAEIVSEVVAPSGPVAHERLRERADHALSLRTLPLAKRIDLLSTAANTVTLLGLLGTVIGLRHAFAPGGSVAAGAGTALVGAGIARALQATALGIVAAIPLLLAQSFLRSRIEDAVADARAAAESLIVVLVKRARAEEAVRAALARERGRAARAPVRPPAAAPEPAAAAADAAPERTSAVVVR